jgi:hypothetical protein
MAGQLTRPFFVRNIPKTVTLPSLAKEGWHVSAGVVEGDRFHLTTPARSAGFPSSVRRGVTDSKFLVPLASLAVRKDRDS